MAPAPAKGSEKSRRTQNALGKATQEQVRRPSGGQRVYNIIQELRAHYWPCTGGHIRLAPVLCLVESRKETRMPEDSLIVITNAIKTAFIDHPSSGHGTTWDQITKSDEESIHLAKAVLIALRKAGYSISKVEEENAPRP